MTKREANDRDEARGYTNADLAEVDDFPELTDAQIAAARPFTDAFPELAASIKRVRGAQKAPTKTQISLRVDPDVLAHFKATGRGWQSRMNDALRKVAGL